MVSSREKMVSHREPLLEDEVVTKNLWFLGVGRVRDGVALVTVDNFNLPEKNRGISPQKTYEKSQNL